MNQPAPAPHDRYTPYTVPLPPPTTALARWKSRAKREVIARGIPKSLLVTRGRSQRGHKQIALTFDDGPDAMTARYLEACDALCIRATFFLIGENVARAPEAVLEYVKRGHEVAGHGYSHEPLPTLGAAQLVDELARTADLLPPSPLPRPFVRPPNGKVNAGTLARVAAAGYTTVLWSLDSDDCRTRDPKVVEARVSPETVAPGEIVLMHEMQPWTLDALPGIVHRLREAGYELVTVGELLGA